MKLPKISFDGPFNHSNDKFTYVTILPTFDFIVDKQMEEGFTAVDGKEIKGVIEYSFGFLWLIFALYIIVEFETGKKLKQ
jgi:hypothetical protein